MTKVAFICTGNSCRSQMAEGLARKLAHPELEAFSARIAPVGVNPKTITVMKEIEIDISYHHSKNLGDIPDEIDYVVTVCESAAKNCPNLRGKKETLHWPIPDPLLQGEEEKILNDFRRIRKMIQDKMITFLRGRNLLETDHKAESS